MGEISYSAVTLFEISHDLTKFFSEAVEGVDRKESMIEFENKDVADALKQLF